MNGTTLPMKVILFRFSNAFSFYEHFFANILSKVHLAECESGSVVLSTISL